jgi:hypothetical protein
MSLMQPCPAVRRFSLPFERELWLDETSCVREFQTMVALDLLRATRASPTLAPGSQAISRQQREPLAQWPRPVRVSSGRFWRRRGSRLAHQDGFGHRLVLLRNAALTALAQPGSPKAVQEELDRISGLALSALDEGHALAQRVRPIELERLGWTRAVEELLARHLATSRVRVFKDLPERDGAVSHGEALCLYRLLEAMARELSQRTGVTTVLLEVKIERESRLPPARTRWAAAGAGRRHRAGRRWRETGGRRPSTIARCIET